VRQNFTGQLKESWKVTLSKPANAKNEELIGELWKTGFGGQSVEPTTKGWVARNVAQEVAQDFLGRFQVHPDFAPVKASIMAYLDQIADRFPVADVLLISGDKGGEDEEACTLGGQERAAKDVAGDAWRLNRYRVASRGDEKLGLSPDQVAEAVKLALEDETNESKDKTPSDYHFRIVRNKPLLMIHVLVPTGNAAVTGRVPAFGVSFPDRLFDEQVEIVANKIWIEQMYGSMEDNPDDEEDFDE
jgi:hypothetical protein